MLQIYKKTDISALIDSAFFRICSVLMPWETVMNYSEEKHYTPIFLPSSRHLLYCLFSIECTQRKVLHKSHTKFHLHP